MSKTGEVVSLSRGARGDGNPFSYREGLQRLRDGATLPALAMGAGCPASWKHPKTAGVSSSQPGPAQRAWCALAFGFW